MGALCALPTRHLGSYFLIPIKVLTNARVGDLQTHAAIAERVRREKIPEPHRHAARSVMPKNLAEPRPLDPDDWEELRRDRQSPHHGSGHRRIPDGVAGIGIAGCGGAVDRDGTNFRHAASAMTGPCI